VSLRFGTDGVRGVAGTELTPELVLELGRAAARVLIPAGPDRTLVVGRDTRWSGPMLQAALSAGLAAEGVDVVDLGVLPTPGVAAVAASRGVAGAVISASHNPFPDNGIKLLATGGRKLAAADETRVEAELAQLGAGAEVRAGTGPATGMEAGATGLPGPAGAATPPAPDVPAAAPTGTGIGRLRFEPEARAWYCQQVVNALEGRRLDGLRVVLDCAHGAAVTTAGDILAAAGADVVEMLGADPDGRNINAGCGSTDPSGLARAVVRRQAAVGLAVDGDADRVIAIDGTGAIVDGDRLLGLFATDLRRRGRLAGDTVVVTVMTNLGFHLAMARAGVAVHQTPVGDRFVLEALEEHRWSLGGEQSGHLIFRDLATTGDGVLSGLLLLDLVVRAERPLAELAAGVMDRLPQVLRNVTVADRDALTGAESVWAEVRAVEAELGDSGRVLLRPSGTEPLVRVMVEATTERAANEAADRLVAAVTTALGR
jgi:phosphoglucosamine mutase